MLGGSLGLSSINSMNQDVGAKIESPYEKKGDFPHHIFPMTFRIGDTNLRSLDP